MKNILLLFLLLNVILSACKKTDNNPNGTSAATALTPYTLPTFFRFPAPYLLPANPLTVQGIKLGRMIFYDATLGSNGRACASCHQQAHAFTADNAQLGLSYSIYHKIPSLVNKAFQPNFTYYGSVPALDLVAELDFAGSDAHLFLDPNLDTVIKRFKSNPEYVTLFNQVFGKDVLNKNDIVQSISYAVSQFVRTITSYGNKFDMEQQGKATFTQSEYNGFVIFYTEKGDCFHCHDLGLMDDNNWHNIGLDSDFTTADKGRYNFTGNPSDIGKFRSPSLRNVALIGPYMHDGRFQTLDSVIEHYNSGVKKSSPNLDPLFSLPRKATGLHLTPQDKADLKAFLMTLTDSSLLKNPALSSPW